LLAYDVSVGSTDWLTKCLRDGGTAAPRALVKEEEKSAIPGGEGRTEARESLVQVFDLLLAAYGPQHWWPGDTPFEVIVGAILTQNTAWQNVAQAIGNLEREGLLHANALLHARPERVKALITPAGYFNVKYERLMGLLSYLASYGLDLEELRRLPLAQVREELLAVKGVGPETADSILLYALERPVFVVDAYTRRLFSRLGYSWMEKATYDEVQGFFLEALAPETALYNEFHALIVVHCRDTCKKKPRCLDCCLFSICVARQ
jgi:endonuclease-3 related protein